MLALKIWISPILLQDYLGNALLNQLKILWPGDKEGVRELMLIFQSTDLPEEVFPGEIPKDYKTVSHCGTTQFLSGQLSSPFCITPGSFPSCLPTPVLFSNSSIHSKLSFSQITVLMFPHHKRCLPQVPRMNLTDVFIKQWSPSSIYPETVQISLNSVFSSSGTAKKWCRQH